MIGGYLVDCRQKRCRYGFCAPVRRCADFAINGEQVSDNAAKLLGRIRAQVAEQIVPVRAMGIDNGHGFSPMR